MIYFAGFLFLCYIFYLALCGLGWILFFFIALPLCLEEEQIATFYVIIFILYLLYLLIFRGKKIFKAFIRKIKLYYRFLRRKHILLRIKSCWRLVINKQKRLFGLNERFKK